MRGVLAHFVGDYVLQSHWMATKKTTSNSAAAAHALTYSLAFLPLRPTFKQYAIITGTHYLIDRYRLARYVVWAKDFLEPNGLDEAFNMLVGGVSPTSEHAKPHQLTATGMQSDVPPWLATWLLILTDNIIHAIINGVTLRERG